MSKTITLEIPDEVFSSFQKQAASKGETAENFVLEIVLKNALRTKNGSSKNEQEAEQQLARWIGAVNSGNPRSADNEQIDADLAQEYGKDL
ncbi:MAG: hypothetical protein ABJA66_20415 [Actinomycetota bacterium]